MLEHLTVAEMRVCGGAGRLLPGGSRRLWAKDLRLTSESVGLGAIEGSGPCVGEEVRLLLGKGPVELSASLGRTTLHIVGGVVDHLGNMVGLDIGVDAHRLELVHVVPFLRALLQHRLVLHCKDLGGVLLLSEDHVLLFDEGSHLLHFELQRLFLCLFVPNLHELLLDLLLEDLLPVGGERCLLLEVSVQYFDVVLLLVVH